MKLKVLYFAIALLVCFPAHPSQAAEEFTERDLFGDWLLRENGSVIRIYGCKGAVCAKLVKVADPNRRDVYNPDPKLRDRPLVGIVLGTSFKKRGPKKWRGRLYNTLDGITYEGTLNMLDKERVTMVGCVFTELLCNAKTIYRTATLRSDSTEQTAPSGNPGLERQIALNPPMPARSSVRTPTRVLRRSFESFLKSQPLNATGPLTASERSKLFEDFLAWQKRQLGGTQN